ncbi:hypothetical protein MMC29_000989 [Sticta canariensis]|nr:hypothetical protein [Sticta canariensis]
MGKVGPPVAPAAMLPLRIDEGYAGTSKWDWDNIFKRVRCFRPVELDDIEPEKRSCDICRESFGPGPADDGTIPEKPVSLPCNHIFGMDCISDWIATSHDPHYYENNSMIQEQPEGSIRENVTNESIDVKMLLPADALWLRWKSFTCPTCRKQLTVQKTSGEQAAAIEARLRFWDSAYEKLGIVRSIDEELCRRDLRQFVEGTKVGQYKVPQDHLRYYEMRARVSAMRFALRRAQSTLTPVQTRLRDALFNLGCYGITDPSTEYCAEWYDNQPLPFWCWHFERIERGRDPAIEWLTHVPEEFLRNWEQKRLGPWRRRLFAELADDRLVWGTIKWERDVYEGSIDALEQLVEDNVEYMTAVDEMTRPAW